MSGYASKAAMAKGRYMEEGYAVESDHRVMAVPNKKIKKPGFIKRWLLKSVKDAIQEEHTVSQLKERASNAIRMPSPIERNTLDSNPLILKIHRANGGTVVETTMYERKTDRHQNQLHIITHDTDLGQGLAKIITMESLRG